MARRSSFSFYLFFFSWNIRAGPALSLPLSQYWAWVPSHNGKVPDFQHRQTFNISWSSLKVILSTTFGSESCRQLLARLLLQNAAFKVKLIAITKTNSGARAIHSGCVNLAKPWKSSGNGNDERYRGITVVTKFLKASILFVRSVLMCNVLATSKRLT